MVDDFQLSYYLYIGKEKRKKKRKRNDDDFQLSYYLFIGKEMMIDIV